MKKILTFLLVPVLLFSIEVKKKASTVSEKGKLKSSTRVYKIKKDTLDKDEDGILDKFMKKMRKEEETNKKVEKRKKIEYRKKKTDYRKKLRYR